MMGSEESEEFDADDEGDESVDDEGLDVDRVIKDMEIAKRRIAKGGEPAWRRLERRMEQQHTAELISDFEDYDIDDGQTRRVPRKAKSAARNARPPCGATPQTPTTTPSISSGSCFRSTRIGSKSAFSGSSQTTEPCCR